MTKAQSCDGKNTIWQFQKRSYLIHLKSNGTQRTTAQIEALGGNDEGLHYQGRIDGGVEECFKVVVFLRLAVHFGSRTQTMSICAEDGDVRSRSKPRICRNNFGKALANFL